MLLQIRLKTIFQGFLPAVAVMAYCLYILAPSVAQAQQETETMTLDQIEAAYLSDDKETARKGLMQLAPKGDAAVNYRLGYMMVEGIGGPVDLNGAKPYLEVASAGGYVPAYAVLARTYLSTNPEVPDYQRAAELLELAVAENETEAYFYLAQMLRVGRGITADKPRAVQLLEQVARAGHADAQFALSQMYARGEGTPKDKAQAVRWLLESAENGSAQAQLSLSFNYQRGTGFPQDDSKAFQWLTVAAKGGSPLAQRMLGAAYLTGDGVEADHAQAIIWLTRAAEAGEAGAQSNLAYAYATGTGVAQDDAEAFRWYTAAADQGLLRAIAAQAQFYETGRGAPKDFERAVGLYLKAARFGHEPSARRLGALMSDGQVDLAIDPERGPDWVAAAARSGYDPALAWLEVHAADSDGLAAAHLAQIYLDGQAGVEADVTRAAELFQDAAERGHFMAQYQLSLLYARGDGVEQDYIAAHKWANLAATAGIEDALKARDTVANLMTPEQIAEAQKQAQAFLEGN